MSKFPSVVWLMIGCDRHGVPRCFGEGPTREVAETRCVESVFAYVRRRRDTGPVDLWTFADKGPSPA